MLLALSLAPDAQAARITVLHGKLMIQRGDKTLSATAGSRLRLGDSFAREGNSGALVRFDDGARLALRPQSRAWKSKAQAQRRIQLPPENHQNRQRKAAPRLGVDPGQIAFGGESELVPFGAGGVKRPVALRIVESVGGC